MDEVTDATFADEVLGSPVPVIVDFWAPWCKPCEAIEPHLLAIAAEHGERVRLVKLNIDENLATPGRYGVLSLPTVVVFAAGEPRETIYGAQPRSTYERAVSGAVEGVALDRGVRASLPRGARADGPAAGAVMLDLAERLLEAVAARDYDAIEACFAADAWFDVLTPRQLREHRSAADAAERYRAWLEPLERFEVLERDAVVIADRVRIRYLFRGRDPASGWQLNEHTGYAAVEDGRIASMTVTCAGFRPIREPN